MTLTVPLTYSPFCLTPALVARLATGKLLLCLAILLMLWVFLINSYSAVLKSIYLCSDH